MHPRSDPNKEWLSDDIAIPVGRREAARLRLSIPARLVTLYDTRRCILVDLSRTGAQVGLQSPLRQDEGIFLQVAGIDQFGSIVRRIVRQNGGINGVEFETPLTDEQVIALRRYSESLVAEERQALRDEVRAWVSGGK